MLLQQNPALKDAIKEIWKEEGPIFGRFLLDVIPEKKLRGARSKYAKQMEDTETAILLYDTSVMGSGKEGYLFTDKRFYYKPIAEKGEVVDIADVVRVSVVETETRKGSHLEKIEFKTATNSLFFLDITSIEFMKHEHGPLFRMLDRTIALLHNPSLADKVKHCNTCGANSGGKFCEYCGSAL